MHSTVVTALTDAWFMIEYNSLHSKITVYLGALTKLRKTTITFIMSLCLSVRQAAHTNNSYPNDNWRFFENLSRIFKLHWNLTIITCTLHEELSTLMIVPRWIFLGTRYVSDKIVENIKTRPFKFSNFLPRKLCRLWDNVEKTGTAGQVTDKNTAHALCTSMIDN